MGLARELLLRGSRNRWLADQLTRRRFTGRAVRRFMPGEDVGAALDAAGALRGRGITTILTLLGENVSEAAEAEGVARHYLEAMERVREAGLDAYVSIKPTQLGLDFDEGGTFNRYRQLLERAGGLGHTLAVDMEDSSYLDRTLELYRRLLAQHPNVVLCLQAYLFRTDADLAALLPLSPRIRLVKGAYKEPRQLAFHRKKDVDASFLRLAETMLRELKPDGAARAIFGTHDPKIIRSVCGMADDLGLDRQAYEFQMLYGIQREAQIRLAEQGYRMRVLISYGDSWFPWYMRRLAERPANTFFLLRNLFSR